MMTMLRDRSGMALLLTLLAVSFMAAVTVHLSSSVNWQMQVAANQGNLAQLDAMLLSGLRMAQAALLADQLENKQDSAFDSWGSLDSEAASALFPDGGLKMQITDLSGLLQVNALVLTAEQKKAQDLENQKIAAENKKIANAKKKNQKNAKQQNQKQLHPKKDKEKQQRELWQRFFRAAGLEDDRETAVLLDSLADWLDTDDEERENGAELGYYSGQSPPYRAANRPVLLLDELLLVKGWQTFFSGAALEEEQQDAEKIRVCLTAVGNEGKVNINTAPALVLQALHEQMSSELAASLITFRQNEDNQDKLQKVDWYKQVPDWPGDISLDQELLTVSSSWFKIKVTAEYKGLRRSGEGLLHRLSTHEQELLWWKVN
jgi:general secretion pathway protein K